ncbi:hypothetical protein ASG75_12785 [Rhodanobacter sp. Soil772]|uniref:hypothetical protein n=1 Tax=Rhodanobacter sp. Soil772 TaxID=1736406 RepID=UPI0006F77609|nr:hypothetical protein [Rhodanobacter sp. Soil772]KRE84760.1 hypothetical protein ASG75_12785 [Rhodanobacter sp. Soil772]
MAANTGNSGGRRGNRWRPAVWGAAAGLLLLPLVAMQFTGDVVWTPFDFMVFGAMLLAACGTYELGARVSSNTAYRAAFGVAVAAGFILVWVNLAVGIIGTENNPANLMFGGVLVVGIIGALIARFRPHGMARALIATAVAQALVVVIAVAAVIEFDFALVGLTVFFVAMWLISAGLFRKAARERTPAGAL